MLDSSAMKDIVYGGLKELARNKEFYYHSAVGPEYSHFTDQGRVVVSEYVEKIMHMIYIAEEESLNKRAKEMVINGLKGEEI